MEYIDLPHLNRYMLKGTVKCQIYKNIPYRIYCFSYHLISGVIT